MALLRFLESAPLQKNNHDTGMKGSHLGVNFCERYSFNMLNIYLAVWSGRLKVLTFLPSRIFWLFFTILRKIDSPNKFND